MSMASMVASRGSVRQRRWPFSKKSKVAPPRRASLRLGDFVIDLGELSVAGTIDDLHTSLTAAWLRESDLARVAHHNLDDTTHLLHAGRARQILALIGQVPQKPVPFYDGGG